jgi:large subunit ribosomal protein L25
MSKNIQIKAEHREMTGKKVKQLRNEGKLPGVIYGKKIEPMNIVMDLKEVTKQLRSVSSSTIVDIVLDGKKYPAILRGKQRHPLKDIVMHVDFQAVSMDAKLRVNVPIVLVGESPAVASFRAILTTGVENLDIEVSAANMPESFEVDITKLDEIGDSVSVKDLDIDDDITVYTNEDDMIVVLTGMSMASAEPTADSEESEEDGMEESEESEEIEE